MREEKLKSLDNLKIIYDNIVAGKQCVKLSDLAIDGKAVLELGVKPGPEVGRILKSLLEEVLEDPALNNRDELTARARDILQYERRS